MTLQTLTIQTTKQDLGGSHIRDTPCPSARPHRRAFLCALHSLPVQLIFPILAAAVSHAARESSADQPPAPADLSRYPASDMAPTPIARGRPMGFSLGPEIQREAHSLQKSSTWVSVMDCAMAKISTSGCERKNQRRGEAWSLRRRRLHPPCRQRWPASLRVYDRDQRRAVRRQVRQER